MFVRFSLVLVSVLSMSFVLHAQTAEEKAMAEATRRRDTITGQALIVVGQQQAAFDRARETQVSISASVTKLETAIDALERKQAEASGNCGVLDFGCQDTADLATLNRVTPALVKARTDLVAAQKSLDVAKAQAETEADKLDRQTNLAEDQKKFGNRNVESAQDRVTDAREAARDRLEAAEERRADSIEAIKGAKAFQEYATIKFKTNDIAERIRQVETTVDKSLVGVYVQQKVAALLNSTSLCSAVNSCAGGKPKSSVNKNAIHNELFSGVPVGGSGTSRKPAPAAGTQ